MAFSTNAPVSAATGRTESPVNTTIAVAAVLLTVGGRGLRAGGPRADLGRARPPERAAGAHRQARAEPLVAPRAHRALGPDDYPLHQDLRRPTPPSPGRDQHRLRRGRD